MPAAGLLVHPFTFRTEQRQLASDYKSNPVNEYLALTSRCSSQVGLGQALQWVRLAGHWLFSFSAKLVRNCGISASALSLPPCSAFLK